MVRQHIILAVYWIGFCFLHSLFASVWFKGKMQIWIGKSFIWYRTFYSAFALGSLLLVIFQQISTPSPFVYEPGMLLQAIGGLVAFVGLLIMSITISKYLFNVYGFNRLFQNKPGVELMQTGIHGLVRHPLYLGTLIFIWGAWIVFPWLSVLISNAIITIYTLIGIRLEERKLELEFGEAYKQYKSKIPMIVPDWWKRK